MQCKNVTFRNNFKIVLLKNKMRFVIIHNINNMGDRHVMNVIPIENAYKISYTATVLNATKQNWFDNQTYNFIGNPKKQHLLLCFFNCSAIYTFKDGTELLVPRNSIVYAPEECEYKVKFTDCDPTGKYNCISINFKLYDENNIPFCFERNIKIYTLKNASSVIESFLALSENYQYTMRAPMKIAGLFYILLSDIGRYYHTKHNILPKYNIIAKGIYTLENTCVNDIKINDLAKMCNVSPVYFRKLFKEYAGVTPMEYKLNALLAQAKQQLVYSDKSIDEIADILKFSSATYFCRIFKKKTGLTPMQYIKSETENKTYSLIQ